MTVNGPAPFEPALLRLKRLAPCAAVSVVPRGLRRAAVTAGTGPAWASYDVDAATMHMERHERGMGAALLE
jgi:hypothetical protein